MPPDYQTIMFVVCAEDGMTSCWNSAMYRTDSRHGDNIGVDWYEYPCVIVHSGVA